MELHKDQRQCLGDPQAGGYACPRRHLRLREAPPERPPRPDSHAGPERGLPAGHPADVLCHARRPPGLRLSDRGRGRLRHGRGRHLSRRRRLRHQLRRPAPQDRLHGRGHLSQTKRAPGRDLQGSAGRRGQGRHHQARPGRAPRYPPPRGGVGGRTGIRLERGPADDRRVRPDEGRRPGPHLGAGHGAGHPPARDPGRGEPFPRDPESLPYL